MRAFVFMVAVTLAGSVVSAQEAPSVEIKRQAEEQQKKIEMLVARARVPLEKTVKAAIQTRLRADRKAARTTLV